MLSSKILLSKSHKLFNKIMSNKRKNHIIEILEGLDHDHLEYGSNIPLDLHLRKYYLNNKEVASIDREFINDQVYNLMRYRGLLDFLAKTPLNWHSRWETFYDPGFEKQIYNENLPPHIRVSFPKDLFNLISNTFGMNKALDYCKVMNERAPLTVRTNIMKVTRDELFSIFKHKGFDVRKTEFSPYGISFNTNPRSNFFTMDEFKNGYFEVQDEASQLVALRVDCKPGDIILDYCGGSAGKSLAIAPFTHGKGQIFIHDVRKNILVEARRRLRRADIHNYQLHNDKSSLKEIVKGKCDWVLLDVPCTGSGTLRRNPDLKWKFSLDRLDELLKIQETILAEATELIKPKGKIVYVTCSLIQEENLNQIVKFCKKFGFKIDNETTFQTVPKSNRMDGFFSATLTK